jgi:hypothetical protein
VEKQPLMQNSLINMKSGSNARHVPFLWAPAMTNGILFKTVLTSMRRSKKWQKRRIENPSVIFLVP